MALSSFRRKSQVLLSMFHVSAWEISIFFHETSFFAGRILQGRIKAADANSEIPPGSGRCPAVRLWKRGQGREERISPAATTARLIFQRVGHREDAASPDPCPTPLASETSEAVQVTKTYDSERTASQGPAPRWSRARTNRRRHDGGGELSKGLAALRRRPQVEDLVGAMSQHGGDSAVGSA